MKTFLLLLTAALAASVGCAAPPYMPAPPVNATDLVWNPSADPTVTAYSVKVWPPAAGAWQTALTTPATRAPGVLTNYPSGSAFCVTATNAVAESLPSNQVTNTVNVAPGAPAALSAR